MEKTPREKAEAIHLVLGGQSIVDVADKFKVSPEEITSWCKAANVPLRRPKIDAYEFVRVWQSSDSLLEVAFTLGVSVQIASMRSMNYRKKGVPLKKLARQKVDWKALAEFTKGLNGATKKNKQKRD